MFGEIRNGTKTRMMRDVCSAFELRADHVHLGISPGDINIARSRAGVARSSQCAGVTAPTD